ncbi:unnamed protein product [Durusdinium trenchii]|uniref:Uncharacterized protein n=1 Tax=Durusdinium trenchii TaxID=1381693 RepID=A0ABP0JI29_9DINO
MIRLLLLTYGVCAQFESGVPAPYHGNYQYAAQDQQGGSLDYGISPYQGGGLDYGTSPQGASPYQGGGLNYGTSPQGPGVNQGTFVHEAPYQGGEFNVGSHLRGASDGTFEQGAPTDLPQTLQALVQEHWKKVAASILGSSMVFGIFVYLYNKHCRKRGTFVATSEDGSKEFLRVSGDDTTLYYKSSEVGLLNRKNNFIEKVWIASLKKQSCPGQEPDEVHVQKSDVEVVQGRQGRQEKRKRLLPPEKVNLEDLRPISRSGMQEVHYDDDGCNPCASMCFQR